MNMFVRPIVLLFILQWPYIYSFSDDNDRARRQADTSCVTPRQEKGVCINVRKCPKLNELLKSTDNGDLLYLQQSQCGIEMGASKVCCPTVTDSIAGRLGSVPPSIPARPTTSRPRVYPTAPQRYPSAPQRYPLAPEQGNPDICGRPTTSDVIFRDEDKIVGALRESVLGNWPWMVSLQYRDLNARRNAPVEHRCGGTLISKQYVLTAAHCFQSRRFQLASVRLGDLDLNSTNDGASPIDVPVARVISHPQFSSSPRQENDIALIRLNRSVEYTPTIRPACLLNGPEYLTENYYNRKTPFVIGWGDTSFRGTNSSKLLETSLNIVNTSICRQNYKNYPAAIDQRILCASGDNADSCQGDSGGPLLFMRVNDNGEVIYYLGGIVSYGKECALKNFPGVYTRVAAYISWISQITGLKY